MCELVDILSHRRSDPGEVHRKISLEKPDTLGVLGMVNGTDRKAQQHYGKNIDKI